jgi:hypothetical protein
MHESLSEREKSEREREREREREETLELLRTLIIMASLLKTCSEEKLRLAARQCCSPSPFLQRKSAVFRSKHDAADHSHSFELQSGGKICEPKHLVVEF